MRYDENRKEAITKTEKKGYNKDRDEDRKRGNNGDREKGYNKDRDEDRKRGNNGDREKGYNKDRDENRKKGITKTEKKVMTKKKGNIEDFLSDIAFYLFKLVYFPTISLRKYSCTRVSSLSSG